MPRKKKTLEDRELEQEMTIEEMFEVTGGMGRLRAHCPVPGCNFECGRMTELNLHMKQVHPEHC